MDVKNGRPLTQIKDPPLPIPHLDEDPQVLQVSAAPPVERLQQLETVAGRTDINLRGTKIEMRMEISKMLSSGTMHLFSLRPMPFWTLFQTNQLN